MALAETAKLAIDLSLTGNAAAGLKGVEQRLTSLNAKTGQIGRGFKTLGAGLGVAIVNGAKLAAIAVGGLTALIVKSIAEGQEAAKVQTIYAVAIRNSAKSTGTFTEQLKAANANLAKAEAAHGKNTKAIQKAKDALAALKGTQQFLGPVTAKYVQILNDQQTALMNLGGVDDELIKSEQTRLIQMGLNGAAVAKLTPLILDFSKATGTDLLTATKLVGKSVNGNVGALARYGVMIDKAKAKTDPFGATVEALNKKFGGTTKALSGSLEARLGAFRENMANIREELGIKLLPAITRIVDVAGKDLVPAFGKFVDRIMPSVLEGINKFADLLENGGAERGIKAISDALGPMVSLLQLAAAPVKAIVSAFLSLPSQVQGVLIGAFAVNKLSGGLVAKGVGEIAGGVIGGGGLLGRGSSPANPLFVSDVMGGAGKAGALAAGGIWSKVGTIIGGAFAIVAVAQLADMIHSAVSPFGGLEGRTNANALLPADQLSWPWGPKNTPKWVIDSPFGQLNLLGGDSAFSPTSVNVRDREGPGLSVPTTHPGGVDSPRTSAATLATIMSAMERGRAKGFKPSFAAGEQTAQRNAIRAAENTRLAVLKAGRDTFSELVRIRMAVIAAGAIGPQIIYSGNTGQGTPQKHPAGSSQPGRGRDDPSGYITVKAVATTRDISTASTVKSRMGPTIAQAGGI